jgi:hypothetical protein
MNQSVKMNGLRWGVVGLTVITAVIHLFLGITADMPMFLVLFILNGIGYLALIAALYFLKMFAPNRSLIRWALLGFTAVTVILYFVFNWPDVWGPIGLFDKAVELVLIILLWMDK